MKLIELLSFQDDITFGIFALDIENKRRVIIDQRVNNYHFDLI